eukprot:342872-Chlamydomonas_euryale.AAC.1
MCTSIVNLPGLLGLPPSVDDLRYAASQANGQGCLRSSTEGTEQPPPLPAHCLVAPPICVPECCLCSLSIEHTVSLPSTVTPLPLYSSSSLQQ